MRAAIYPVIVAFSAGAVSAVQFLSIGDWGDSGAKEVAPFMGQHDPDFVLSLGDNFYSNGINASLGVTDPQFKDKFEDVFAAESLQVPWYVCAGNHDYYGGPMAIAAEMEYSNHSTRWVYPDFYFSRDVEKDGVKITIVSIDTWRLNGGSEYVLWDLRSNTGVLRDAEAVRRDHAAGVIDTASRDVLLRNFPPAPLGAGDHPFPGPKGGNCSMPTVPSAPAHCDADQLTWIRQALAASDADWKLVMGHYPIHSATVSEHGDTPVLIEHLQPVLEAAGVDAYLFGHDHILQHIEQGGVHYIGSGAGAKKHTGVNASYVGLQGYHDGHYGFMVHEANKTTLTTTFVDDTGAKPYTFTIQKGTKASMRR